jgi:hypothetical protein
MVVLLAATALAAHPHYEMNPREYRRLLSLRER